MANGGTMKSESSRRGRTPIAMVAVLLLLTIGLGWGAYRVWDRPAGVGSEETLEDEVAFLEAAGSDAESALITTAVHETSDDASAQVQPAALMLDVPDPDAPVWLVGTIDVESEASSGSNATAGTSSASRNAR